MKKLQKSHIESSHFVNIQKQGIHSCTFFLQTIDKTFNI